MRMSLKPGMKPACTAEDLKTFIVKFKEVLRPLAMTFISNFLDIFIKRPCGIKQLHVKKEVTVDRHGYASDLF
jgi:hypothetical protein